jgi:hypothetical protein
MHKGFNELVIPGRRAQVLFSLLPIIFAVNVLAATSVMLEWDANTETDLAGYKIYYGPASGIYTNVVDVGNLISNRVSGLLLGTEYFFAVTAYNTSGVESPFSNEVGYKLLNGTNAPPTLAPISDLILSEDAPERTIIVTGISPGSLIELQSLTLTAVSDNPGVIPNPVVQYVTPAITGTLTLAPMPNANGVATITVTVDDGGAIDHLARQSFMVTVEPVNDAPGIDASGIGNQTIQKNQSTPLLPFTVSDPETPAGNLAVTASSSNTDLVSASRISLAGSGSNRTVQVAPEKGRTGTARITLEVSDGELRAATTFLLTVTSTPVPATTNNPPLIHSVSATASGVTIEWNSISGEEYQVLYKETLSDPAWRVLSGYIHAEGPVTAWTDSGALSTTSRYYRVLMTIPSAGESGNNGAVND